MVEMVGFSTVNSEIIQENLHECWNIFMKNLLNYPLKCSWSCFLTKHHYYNNKYSPFRNKGCLLLVIRMNPNLVIAAETIQKSVNFMTNHRIENTICEW